MNIELLEGGGVRFDWESPVATVTLDRPDKRNSQTPHTWAALTHIADNLPDDCRIVLLRGSGSSFSAGLDKAMFTTGVEGAASIMELVGMAEADFDAEIAKYQQGFAWLRRIPAVTIAVVRGYAVGAGFQLALAADFMLVADDASLIMKEPQLGLVPDLTGTHPLVHAVGYSRAVEICLTGRSVSGREAAASGIAAHSVPEPELEDLVDRTVAAILQCPAGADLATKRLLQAAVTNTAVDQQAAERRAQRIRLRTLTGGA